LGDPRLVLIEDCWHNLEQKEQENIIDFLTDKDNQFTLIAVTNDLQFAQRCDRVVVMDEGRIIAEGTYAEVSGSEQFRSSFAKWSL
jgi:energy-coupling factor transporter ATP-binding protein EcfA2